jgi:hypothetical protein
MTWTQRERDNVELGPVAAGHLLAEQAPDDTGREHHITLVGGHALSIRWGRTLEGGRVP